MVPSPGRRSSSACSSHRSAFFHYSSLPPPALTLNLHTHLIKGQPEQHILFKTQVRCGFIGCRTMFSVSLPIPSPAIPSFGATAGRRAAAFTQPPARPPAALQGCTPARSHPAPHPGLRPHHRVNVHLFLPTLTLTDPYSLA